MPDAFPLAWPAGWARTKPHDRKRAKFGAGTSRTSGEFTYRTTEQLTVAKARDRLMKEIRAFTPYSRSWRINPETVVISSNLVLRNDGLPRSGQPEPTDPGVAVFFTLDGVPYCLPCDRWDRAADNLAAVAAHLGAMRGMERWGVGDVRQHFAGFKSLPAPDQVSPARWRLVLGVPQDEKSLATVEAQYKKLRSQHHPDRGGDPAVFDEIQRAWEQAQEELR